MNHSSHPCLHRRAAPDEQFIHDRALFRILLLLISMCVVCIVLGKATGYGQEKPSASAPNSPKAAQKSAPQAAPPPPAAATKSEFEPSEIQRLKLDNAQLRAVNAQQAWNAAALKLPEYQLFTASVNSLAEECTKIKAENKWPAEVQCNINVSPVTFARAPSAPTASTPAPAPATPSKVLDKK